MTCIYCGKAHSNESCRDPKKAQMMVELYGGKPVSQTQVIIRKDDRHWDSIKDTDRQALFRICEYMKDSRDADIYLLGRSIWLKLIFGHAMESAIEAFKAQGFEVTIKPVGDQTNEATLD